MPEDPEGGDDGEEYGDFSVGDDWDTSYGAIPFSVDFGSGPRPVSRPRYDRGCITAVVGMGKTSLSGLKSYHQLSADARRIFRPFGMQVWGATDKTLLHSFCIGNIELFSVGEEPIPGLFFSSPKTFEEFFEALKAEEPPEDLRLPDIDYAKAQHLPFVGHVIGAKDFEKKFLPKKQRLTGCPTLEIGHRASLRFSGPLDQAVLWGLTLRD